MTEAMRRTAATRSFQEVRRQVCSKALRAAAMAWRASSRVPLAKRPSTMRVSAGLVSWKVSLVSTARPPMYRPWLCPSPRRTLSRASS
jgi:hypothetical protein